jgi:hypothetical protein
MSYISYIAAVAVALLLVNLWQWFDRRLLWKAMLVADDNTAVARKERNELQRQIDDEHLPEIRKLRMTTAARTTEAESRAAEAEAKTQRYFAEIESACNQRNHWSKLYQDMSTQYGNAQDLMIRTIERLARQLQAAGIKPKVPPVIKAVRDEFFAAHVPGQVTPVQEPEQKALANSSTTP